MIKPLCWCLAIAGLAVPLPLHAQSNEGILANLVPDLILKGITLPGAGDPGRPHAGHFTLGNPTFGGSQPGSEQTRRGRRPSRRSAIGCGRSSRTFPSGRRPAASPYSFDEASGIYTRSTESFGPAFTERALTDRPPQVESWRQLSAHELRYLRRRESQ